MDTSLKEHNKEINKLWSEVALMKQELNHKHELTTKDVATLAKDLSDMIRMVKKVVMGVGGAVGMLIATAMVKQLGWM